MPEGHPPAGPAPGAGFLKRLAREPLLHFFAAGLAIFAAQRAMDRGGPGPAPGPGPGPGPVRIEIDADHVQRLTESWTLLWQRPPTAEELAGLVETEVREEVLYREAVAMGLDRDDTIIRRRLVQKMEFLAEDAPSMRDPEPQDLRAWYETHRDRFLLPPRISFTQVYFSFFKHKDRAREEAVQALDDLAGLGSEAADDPALGDRFMFQLRYEARSREEVSQTFGARFADALFQLPAGEWQGPLESSFGWHLARIDRIITPETPPFETVEPQVRYEWLADQRAAARRQAFERLRSRYEIVLPPGVGP
jgi:hypothetical protein